MGQLKYQPIRKSTFFCTSAIHLGSRTYIVQQSSTNLKCQYQHAQTLADDEHGQSQIPDVQYSSMNLKRLKTSVFLMHQIQIVTQVPLDSIIMSSNSDLITMSSNGGSNSKDTHPPKTAISRRASRIIHRYLTSSGKTGRRLHIKNLVSQSLGHSKLISWITDPLTEKVRK